VPECVWRGWQNSAQLDCSESVPQGLSATGAPLRVGATSTYSGKTSFASAEVDMGDASQDLLRLSSFRPGSQIESDVDSAPSSAMLSKVHSQRNTKKLTPELRKELKQALRDSSDWHPRLNEEVARITGIKTTQRVRSRIYVTSASTLHSLVNILRHGNAATGADGSIVSKLDNITDLNYLTHIVFRCYERDDDEAAAALDIATKEATGGVVDSETLSHLKKARYRVEVSMSPGMQVLKKDGEPEMWPKGHELYAENCGVAPLQIVSDWVQLDQVEHFLTEVVKEYGGGDGDDSADEEKQSD